jgi:UDP-N-acetyl-D-mannosaminuronate dehydrogenase
MESDENMGPDQTRVAIVGLGYIGLPTAVAFGRTHRGTVGADIGGRKLLSDGGPDTAWTRARA